MEARQTLRGNAVPTGLMVVIAIGATVALAATGAALSKSFGTSGAPAANVGHPAPGTVLRQDNPVQSSTLIDRGAERGATSVTAPVRLHPGSGGVQFVEDWTVGNDGNGYLSDLTRVLPTETQGYNPGWDAKSVREGHGA